MVKRKHRDDIVDGSDDSDEVAEVSMEDMLNKDRAAAQTTTTTMMKRPVFGVSYNLLH
jgi:hypothetical protein